MKIDKFVIDGMKCGYSGPFSVSDFFQKVETWMHEKGKETELKSKREEVTEDSKNIEWTVEFWQDASEWSRIVIRIRALFKDVRDVKVKVGKAKKVMQKGNAIILIDGILETDVDDKWANKPTMQFMRTILDKFVYRFHMNKLEDRISKEAYETHDMITDFFSKCHQ